MLILLILVLFILILVYMLTTIAKTSEKYKDDVDVVFTWVDGMDTSWFDQKTHYRTLIPDNTKEDGIRDPMRVEKSELPYAIRTVKKFLPWVRNIYVVTQRPQNPNIEGVIVVHHDELVDDKDILPTFNSHSIETFLHRIPGLSEKFLYLNDDQMVSLPMRKDDFFDPKGRPYFRRGHESSFKNIQPVGGWVYAWYNLTNLLDPKKVYTLMHQATPLTKSILINAEKKYPEWLETRQTKFRDKDNIPPIALALNDGAYSNTVNIDGPELRTIIVSSESAIKEWSKSKFHLFCVNHVSSQDEWKIITDRIEEILK